MSAKKKVYKLPPYLAPREENNKYKYKYIPKKIFQTGGSCEVTKGMYDAVHTWVDKNPDWEYHFFDNKACRDFIKEHFPKKVLDAYDNLIPGAYKADLWRYCVLYIHGGVYVDNKCELLASSLNDVIPEDVEFLSVLDIGSKNNCREFPGYIYQAFVCSKPKHVFLEKVIDMVVDHVETGFYGYDPLSPTGPGLLGKAINLAVDRQEKEKHIVGINNVSGVIYRLWKNKYYTNGCVIDEDNMVIFRNHYLEYYDECKKMGFNHYTNLWYQSRVYKNGKGVLRHQKEIQNNHYIYNQFIRHLYQKKSFKVARINVFKFIFKHPLSIYRVIKSVFRYEVLERIKNFL